MTSTQDSDRSNGDACQGRIHFRYRCHALLANPALSDGHMTHQPHANLLNNATDAGTLPCSVLSGRGLSASG